MKMDLNELDLDELDLEELDLKELQRSMGPQISVRALLAERLGRSAERGLNRNAVTPPRAHPRARPLLAAAATSLASTSAGRTLCNTACVAVSNFNLLTGRRDSLHCRDFDFCLEFPPEFPPGICLDFF